MHWMPNWILQLVHLVLMSSSFRTPYLAPPHDQASPTTHARNIQYGPSIPGHIWQVSTLLPQVGAQDMSNISHCNYIITTQHNKTLYINNTNLSNLILPLRSPRLERCSSSPAPVAPCHYLCLSANRFIKGLLVLKL